jgi:thioredoxin-dependent peroxiredoxin
MATKTPNSLTLLPAQGSKAPDFSGKNQHGKSVKLSSFKGKSNVVLYFYPRDMTPGCTTEACDFRDQLQSLKDTIVIGVSADTQEKHQKFIEKYSLPFDLIADEEKKILNQYGVWQEKNLYGKKSMGIVRTTFIIDKKGILHKVFPKVRVKGHVDAVLEALSEL